MKYSKPMIGSPDQHDFHDSGLMSINMSKDLTQIEVDLKIGYGRFSGETWRIVFSKVLRFEFETIGQGLEQLQPVNVYDVYLLKDSLQIKKWKERLGELEVPVHEGMVYHIVLASGDFHSRDYRMEGIEIVCRHFEIVRAL